MQEKNFYTGLNQLLKILSDNEIDFVVIGGFACVVYGTSLVTRDLDVCAVLTPENIQKLRKILAPYHPKHRMTPQKLSFLEEPRSLSGVNNLYLDTDLGMIDFLSDVKGLGGLERLKQKAKAVSIFGHSVHVLSLDDLILAKEQLSRPKDKAAVQELKELRSRKGVVGTSDNVVCEVSSFEDLSEEVGSFVLGAAEREFGNIPIVQQHIWARAEWCISAHQNGVILGSVSLVTRTASFDGKSVAVVGINNLITEPNNRKKGIGKLLMHKAIEYCFDTLKGKAVVLFCADNLINYYQQLGFTKVNCPVWIEQPSGKKTWPSNCLVSSHIGIPTRTIDLCGFPW